MHQGFGMMCFVSPTRRRGDVACVGSDLDIVVNVKERRIMVLSGKAEVYRAGLPIWPSLRECNESHGRHRRCCHDVVLSWRKWKVDL